MVLQVVPLRSQTKTVFCPQFFLSRLVFSCLEIKGILSAKNSEYILENKSFILFYQNHLFFFFLSGLVKAVNTAVDLIVAHFGTSRDPDVKVEINGGSD